MSDYLLRLYGADSTRYQFSVYVGYYEEQVQGRSIHSPKNCLPGAGWEALASTTVEITTPEGPRRVNRYLLQNQGARALVLYWYQGRGRIESNEYVVKWNLLRDAALRQRSDEALVRVVVGVETDMESAYRVAAEAAAAIIAPVRSALAQ
jgi:EpsI family protein